MSGRAVTERDCLRNVLRRTGRAVPPIASVIARPLTDDELQALTTELLAILIARKAAA